MTIAATWFNRAVSTPSFLFPSGERKQQGFQGSGDNSGGNSGNIYKLNMATRQHQASSPAESARLRLSNISSHIMGSSNPSVFTASSVAAAPEDPLFGLAKAYREDTSDKKIDLGIGAYRDDNAKPWILPVVKKVSCPHAWQWICLVFFSFFSFFLFTNITWVTQFLT